MLLCTARSLPVASPRATVRLGVQDMEGTGPETGGQVFDPIGLSKIASSETLAWYRAAELKHGRIAMVRGPRLAKLPTQAPVPADTAPPQALPVPQAVPRLPSPSLLAVQAAVTGWAWVSSGGPLFPGYISVEQGITFESLGRDGYAAWDATPENGKAQILGIVGLLEILGESAIKPHYMVHRPAREAHKHTSARTRTPLAQGCPPRCLKGASLPPTGRGNAGQDPVAVGPARLHRQALFRGARREASLGAEERPPRHDRRHVSRLRALHPQLGPTLALMTPLCRARKPSLRLGDAYAPRL